MMTKEFLREIISRIREGNQCETVDWNLTTDECIDLLTEIAWEKWFDTLDS